MEITRRRLLSALSAAGLLAVIPAGRADAATAAKGRVQLLANTVAVLAGTAASNARPETAAKLAAVDRAARANLKAMDDAGEGELFAGLALGTDEANLNTAYRRLYETALATRTPGSGGLYGDTAVQRRVLDGLAWLHERHYGDQSKGYYGNWFHWEIGISQHITKTLVLLADETRAHRPELVRAYVSSMDAYLRNGTDGDVNLDSRFHTGANLADITTNRVLQGALLGDDAGDARIRKALTDQLTVFLTIDPYHLRHGVTDGHYADGSFIQHASVAYTGSYGKGLLSRVVQTLKILDGTGFAHGEELVPTVYGWVKDGFAPLIFEGWMMEIVKGRAVARTESGYADVAVVVEAVVDLASLATGTEATALKSYVKHLRATSRTPLDPARFVSPVSIVRYADIIGDPSPPPADLNPATRSVAFNAMDKTVHRRPGYAFALARSSDRISKYEYMNGENLMPWFQGDGAHYLYLSGQDQTQAYGVDYFTTVSPYGLAGVTAPVEQRRTIPELYGKAYYDNPGHPLHFTSSSESQNTYLYFPRGTNAWSGGAVLGAYGAAGLVQSSDAAYRDRALLPDDFVVYRGARATKSWFLFDEEIVVLAAGVGDAAGRAVTTTVDARVAAPDDRVTLTGTRRDGRAWSGPGTADLRRLRYANATQNTAVGYVFLDTPPVRVTLERVTRSRRAVRTANPDTAVTRSVCGVTVDGAAGARPARLAYALVPNATEDWLRAHHHGPLKVLANSPRLQAVSHSGLGMTAANSFTPGRHETAGLCVEGPASVIVRRRGRGGAATTTVAVSDPTMDRDRITVLLRGRRLGKVTADEGVRVSRDPGGTRIDVDTRHAYGKSFTVTLRG
ncbi:MULTISPECIES: polysaccharide lyase family 8 super-sandwich domain-containing protein [Streptomyces]|uniref:polysaccharide lyase family 8 super-sandwich domain-containing protein n=1 Tax=Streptomyces TaxID=1883 RepID=UPI001E3B64B0|nr:MULTISPECIES: polysaccharide lyase family 8 super-sandwich domain-containing protein [Streptomyces]UFQ20414.1 polysaccharide lyase beta-sandwich domain-containing protein [Streptomyces huasconensis]WCL90023.1 polysaccharide lyase family 8 super-sandwich domain-containing protein [Streptomyces sp. JCM 35825]